MSPRLVRAATGALIGLVSAGIAVGVGEVAAAFVRAAASPVIAVGNRLVVLTPGPVKRWAIEQFGTSDKTMLLTGIYVIIGILALVIGGLAMWRLRYGLAGFAVFGALGVYCALTAPGTRSGDWIPAVAGTIAALGVMTALVRTVTRPDERDDTGRAPAGTSRRRFLEGTVAAAGLAAATGFAGRAAQHKRFDVAPVRAKLALPAPARRAVVPAGADLGKSPVPWVTPNSAFYRVDTALSVPQVDPKSWALHIYGMVDHEIKLSYDQLLARPMIERWITLNCVSNEVGGGLIGNARFLGVRLADLLREAGLHRGCDQLVLASVDGMTIGAPTAVVMDGRDALVAVGMNGVPLPVEHGFPARIVVPGLYGYVSACKWVTDILATTFVARRAFWVDEGWAQHPKIELASRIDTLHTGKLITAGTPFAVAGVAWDQHVGVSAVQVQVENGPWHDARLATVPSTDTWRQWVWAWTPPKVGSYTVRVRAFDAKGNPQTASREPPYPSGATGLHTVIVRAQ